MRSLLPERSDGKIRPTIKPEERLLLAVVESAYWDLRSADPSRRRTARAYFLDDTDRHTFGFVAICQHFGWSPASIRNQLGTLLHAVTPGEGIDWIAAKAPMAPSVR